MRKFYLVFILSFYKLFLAAQITSPVIRANFGVEGDLSSNYYNNANLPDNDDWFGNGLSGTGNFVIDTTGASGILSSYSIVANRSRAFSRFMRVAPYTTVNNHIWLDAVFHRDYHGIDSTVFGSGSNKNGMSPAEWFSAAAGNIPDKNEILDAFTHIRRAGPDLTDSLWMFGGLSIENTNGNRYFDFELYQTDIRFDRAALSFLGYGPDEGHTSWQFDAAGNILVAGDIILSAEYSSSSLSSLEARIWINKASLAMTPSTFTWGGKFNGDGNGAQYGYASIVPKTSGSFYTGLQSGSNAWAGSFGLVRQDNSLTNVYEAGQFMEFSVNLSKLGLDPGKFGINPCGSPFRRVLIKTRSSTSFTAELKDFIAPFSLFNYKPVDGYGFLIYFCGSMPNTPLNIANPNPDLVYRWSTTDGNIVGAQTGSSITVNSPGTYIVSQQFDLLCPEHSRDSITIMFDAVCTTLDVKLLKFTATHDGANARLNWDVGKNEVASWYEPEYSTDNQNFKKLVSRPALSDSGIVSYNHVHDLDKINGAAITYRLKIIEKTGKIKYSNSILLRLNNKKISQPVIFPNPIKEKAWVAIQAADKSIAEIYITDIYGRPVLKSKYEIRKGENIIALTGLQKLSSGVYFVVIKTAAGESTKKIIISK